jgi:hypothetical protein
MKQKNYLKKTILLLSIFLIGTTFGQIYDADFSNNDDGFSDHTTDSPPTVAPASVGPFGTSYNKWELSYTSTPATDGSGNIFKVRGGKLESEDWGGQGIFQSQSIDISAINNINISASTINIGANDDKFKYFYILDGGSRIETSNFSSTNGQSVNYSLSNIDVSTIDTLVVGFEFSENGSGNGYSTSSFTVTNTENPTVNFDTTTSTVTETNTDIITNGIPISFTNFNTDVTITATVNGASTAEHEDYIIDLTPILFNTNETNNIPLTIKADADSNDETLVIDFTITAGTAITIISQHTITITDDEVAPKPNLIITEVADPIDTSGRFVEIYNNGTTTIDLSTEQIYFVKSVNAGSSYSQTALTGTINPNTVFIIGNSTNINASYGFVPDKSFGSADGNGDDAYYLYYGGDRINGNILDAFGATGIDGTDQPWEYENSRAIRLNPTTVLPNSTWTDSEWAITLADVADMTPGALESEFRYDGNWKPRNVFVYATAIDDVIILSDVTTTASINANNLEINSSTTLTVDTDNGITLANNLTNNGILIGNSGSSLIVNGSSTGNITYNRTLTTPAVTGTLAIDNLEGWYLMSSPVSGLNFDDTWITNNSIASGTGNNKGIATYNNAVASNNWSYAVAPITGTSFAEGTGYSIKRSTTGTVSFTGTIRTTDVTNISLTKNTNGYNLVGNIFTGYVSLNELFTANDSVGNDLLESSTIWIWNSSTKSYDTKMVSDNFQIAPGQGFFVETSATTSTFTFNKSMLSHKTDTFLRSSKPEIQLNIADGKSTKYAKIYYLDNATTTFDNGFDGKLFGGIKQPFAIYTHLVSESKGENYQTQSLPNSNLESMVIPVGVNVKIGKEITFSAKVLNLPTEIKVFLEDRLTKTFTRLDETNSEYKITLTEALNGIGRFYLHTAQSVLSTDDVILNSISIFKTNSSTLKIAGLPQGKTSISLYNILGKEMMSTSFTSYGNKEISLSKLSSGIYLAKVKTEKGVLSKKIILE